MTVLHVIGGIFIALGGTMFLRGLIYTLKPDGAMALKRKQVNLRRGFTTDMKVFGRKVRRLGFIIASVGGLMLGGSALRAKSPATPTTTAP
jgi:hypothetical protein